MLRHPRPVGVLYAWLTGRTNIPLKGLMKTLFVIPYMFPPFIGAVAWGLLLALLPYSVPGIVLAIGAILMWSGTFYVNLYNTIWIILVAYIARYVAFAMKSSSASLERERRKVI